MFGVLLGAVIGIVLTVAFEAVAIYLILIRDKRKLKEEE